MTAVCPALAPDSSRPGAARRPAPLFTMKTIILAACVWAALTVPAWAGLPLGRGEVTASLTATATHDSNVFGTPAATADWSGLLIPRLSYVRKAGRIEAEATAGISFIRYLEQEQLDADNLDGSVTLRLTEADFRNYNGLVSAAYRESSELNTDLNLRTNTKTTIFSGRGALITGPRTNAAASATYTDSRRSTGSDQQLLNTEALYDYKDFFYGNSLRLVGSYDELRSSGDNALGVPLNQNSYVFSAGLGRALYHNTLRGGISAGYRVLNRSAAETADGVRSRSGYVIGASLEGPFLPERYFPKVTSEFAISYQDAATPGIQDTGSKALTGRLHLAWQARELTRVSFTADRSQRLSADDITVVQTTVRLGLEQTLRPNLTGSLSAAHDWASYGTLDREDRTLTLAAGLRYKFARVWSADFSSIYTDTQSTIPRATYSRHLNSLSLTREF